MNDKKQESIKRQISMKTSRIIALLCLVLCGFLPMLAQSVLGIKFGSSYDDVKEMLERRFGLYSVREKNGNLSMYDCQIGDVKFQFAEFYFQYAGNRSYFNSASFSIPFELSMSKKAQSHRDYLYSFLKSKYENDNLEEYVNEDGYKCYKFGINPIDSSKVLGLITLMKGESKDGKMRLFLDLDYLPIYFVDKAADF